ncbi:MAG TPA: DoxX family protein [Acidimicrobiia bacterium]|nr:DoxX family protein [Acidimicrobiia bacterium]
MEAIDLGLFILRLAIGAVMIAHGLNHGRNLDSTATWFESIGFRQAKMQAFLAAAGELAIGTGLIFGFLTTFASAGLVATMVVAGVSNHRKAGFFAFNRPIEGWEYVMTLGVVGLTMATIGAGEWSIDNAAGLDFSGWPGFIIGLAGIGAGITQLAVFWRPPAEA